MKHFAPGSPVIKGAAESLKVSLAPFWAKESTQNTSGDEKLMANAAGESRSSHVLMYSCEYWVLLKKMF